MGSCEHVGSTQNQKTPRSFLIDTFIIILSQYNEKNISPSLPSLANVEIHPSPNVVISFHSGTHKQSAWFFNFIPTEWFSKVLSKSFWVFFDSESIPHTHTRSFQKRKFGKFKEVGPFSLKKQVILLHFRYYTNYTQRHVFWGKDGNFSEFCSF